MACKEPVFTEADLSVFSIVPSRASITSSRRSIDSFASTELRYKPLAFENALFSSYVYKRNFRFPLIWKSRSSSDPVESDLAVSAPGRRAGKQTQYQYRQKMEESTPKQMGNTIPSLAKSLSVYQDGESDLNAHHSVFSITPTPAPTAFDEGSNVLDQLAPQSSDLPQVQGHQGSQSFQNSTRQYHFCTFCQELGRDIRMKTIRDWATHEITFHEAVEKHTCLMDDCGGVLSCARDFSNHCDIFHPGQIPTHVVSRFPVKHAYGCGFCAKPILRRQKWISTDLWKARCDHVLTCMRSSDPAVAWAYSKTIIALLEQPALGSLWRYVCSQQCQKYGIHLSQLNWHPSTSRLLRQRLESLDVGPSIEIFLMTAFDLGLQDGSGDLRSIGILGGMTMSAG